MQSRLVTVILVFLNGLLALRNCLVPPLRILDYNRVPNRLVHRRSSVMLNGIFHVARSCVTGGCMSPVADSRIVLLLFFLLLPFLLHSGFD